MLWVDAVGLGALDGGGGGGGFVFFFCFDLWEEESDDGAFDSCVQALDRGSCPAASVVAAFLALVVAASTTIAASVVAVSFVRQVRWEHAVADTSVALDELGGIYSGYVPCAGAFFI